MRHDPRVWPARPAPRGINNEIQNRACRIRACRLPRRSRLRRDVPLCIPGRPEVARSLFAQRDLHPWRAGQRLRGPHQARQGPQDHARPRRALGDASSRRAGASICARASSSTTARTSPPTTSCFRPNARARPGLRRQDAGSPAGAKAVKVDDYTVDFVLAEPKPHPALRMGHLVHPVEEMGRGEQLADRAAARPASR